VDCRLLADGCAVPQDCTTSGCSPGQVEDAILERLRPLQQCLGVKTVTAFQGALDAEGWDRLRRGFPAILVVYAGSPAFVTSGKRLEERMEFEVYVMDKSYRAKGTGQQFGRPEADGGHPGTYALLSAVRARLLGVAPLTQMGPCLPLSVNGFTQDNASVYRLRLSTTQHIIL
ncbi:MAG: phage protein Gp37, partial [Bilophila sp.]